MQLYLLVIFEILAILAIFVIYRHRLQNRKLQPEPQNCQLGMKRGLLHGFGALRLTLTKYVFTTWEKREEKRMAENWILCRCQCNIAGPRKYFVKKNFIKIYF